MKRILGIVILLALGGFMVLGGLGQTTTDEVTCGGQVMAPGDICQETRGSSTTQYSFEEQKENERGSGWVLVGIGGVLLAAGLASGAAAVLRRDRRPPAPAAPPTPAPFPGTAPFPGSPPFLAPQQGAHLGPAPYQGGRAPYPPPNGAQASYRSPYPHSR